jgi:trans-2,3-dihydro-3-hydroxyanthranilate isomerase
VASYRYVVCDVFTDTPLAGNQVGVFTDARDLTAQEMQLLARELNYSESTFVLPAEDGGHARIRIFTPAVEVPFAGHPTLGTAFVLAAPLQLQEIRLETGNGVVPVRLEREENRLVFGRMQQPLPTVEAFEREAELLAALSVERSELPVELYDNGMRHVYVALPSEADVAALRPRLDELAELGRPLLVGFSRKSSLGKILGDAAAKTGTVAASVGVAVAAYERGATILRVHDVREHVEALAAARAVVAGP